MIQKQATLAICALGILAPVGFGFASDNSSLTRSFERTVALTNAPVVVTVTFTNGGASAARGFFYSDQVPSGLVVATLSLTLDGRGLTNYTFEAGQDGDVYPGCTVYRWALEQPPGFTEANPVPSQASVQIIYSISSPMPGVFNLQQFNWAGFNPANTNAAFGYSENADQQMVRFVTAAERATVSGQHSTNGFVLRLTGVPQFYYALEASTNLSAWFPLVTNVSPFGFTETNAPAFPGRFYRARWLP